MTNEPTRIVKEFLVETAAKAEGTGKSTLALDQMDGRVLVSEAVVLKLIEYLKKIHEVSVAGVHDPATLSAFATASDARNCITVLLGDVQVERVAPGVGGCPMRIRNHRVELWAHIVSEHANCIGPTATLEQLEKYHRHEHRGPGTIRNHPEESRAYSLKKLGAVLSESEE